MPREKNEVEEGFSRREKEKRERKEMRGERDENAFAYEIKWRIYTVRSQYTYIRPTVNYTVNRGVLFERGKGGSRAKQNERERRIRKSEEKEEETKRRWQRRPSLWSAR